MREEPIDAMSLRRLLEGETDYLIPMYQRNYAWGEAEITQLIQDILDYMPKPNEAPRNYYIGTLVVYARDDGTYETIDGQQRLTTLTLLACWLRRRQPDEWHWLTRPHIRFQNRPQSEKTLMEIFSGDATVPLSERAGLNAAMVGGYEQIERALSSLVGARLPEFTAYLLAHVTIMRVEVPPGTRLNHYFEIMNSRGEQLEKHEILKSLMLEKLKDDGSSQNCFRQIWEACAEMSKYVQATFPPVLRGPLFGDGFRYRDFEGLRTILGETATQAGGDFSFDAILQDTALAQSRQKEPVDEPAERFRAVINFPNFLLHVLSVSLKKALPLDDKQLIPVFKEHVLKPVEAATLVKQFAYNLLKCKYLLDRYIVKRETSKNDWSLYRYQWGSASEGPDRASYVGTFEDADLNLRLLMLLSAFDVSTPTMAYKYWLNAALLHLYHTETVNAEVYLARMESVAIAFVFDRFLAPDGGLSYEAIIYDNGGECQASPRDANEDMLTYGRIPHNFIFNYLDYLLWLTKRRENPDIAAYRFTARSSVEHHYPQNPDRVPKLVARWLHCFGNLHLVSHSRNSRVGNLPPGAKNAYYSNSMDSIKQHIMSGYGDGWNEVGIGQHDGAMKQVLKDSCSILSPSLKRSEHHGTGGPVIKGRVGRQEESQGCPSDQG